MTHPERALTQIAFYTDAVGWGGAEEIMAAIARSLPDRVAVTVIGVDADVVARVVSSRPGAAGVVVSAIRNKRALRAMSAHRRVLRRVRPQILHVNLQTPAAARFAVAIAATVPGLRIVVVEHLPKVIGHASTRWLKRVTERRISAHVAVGTQAARDVEELVGLPSGTVRVIHNGVPAPGPPRASADERREAAEAVIGTVGRLVPQKGVDLILRALAELPSVRLEVVGDGPDADELAELAAELGVAHRVTWHGWSSEPRTITRRWGAFVLASRYEGLPVTVLEAMAEGVPVVATDVGSVSDIVRDGTGWLVPPEDVPALANAIRAALTDDAARKRIVSNAGQLVRAEFSSEGMCSRYAALYEEVLQS